MEDPYLYLSYLNTKLRDEYPSLAELADDLGLNAEEIVRRMGEIGYVYDPAQNRFVG